MTPEQLNKLPKWAQEEIQTLSRQRDTAVETLNAHIDQQTPSPFYVEDYLCTGEQRGPSAKRRYIQAHWVKVDYQGVHLEIILSEDSRTNGIKLSWDDSDRKCSHVCFCPTGFNQAILIHKDQMR